MNMTFSLQDTTCEDFPSHSYVMFCTIQLAFDCTDGYYNYNTVILQQSSGAALFMTLHMVTK